MRKIADLARGVGDLRQLIYEVYVVALAKSNRTVVRAYVLVYAFITCVAWAGIGSFLAGLPGLVIASTVAATIQYFNWRTVRQDIAGAREQLEEWGMTQDD